MSSPIILTLVERYLPGYKGGGPLRTIDSTAERFSNELSFKVVASDRDVGDRNAYRGVREKAWNRVGVAEVRYLAPSRQGLGDFAELLNSTPHDVLYLNSFFAPAFTLKPLLLRRLGLVPRRPVIIAPRGEFSPMAFALKTFRKKAFVAAGIKGRIYDDLWWQASSELEAHEIAAIVGDKHRIIVAGDLARGSRGDGDGRVAMKHSGRLNLIFVSRLCRKKNLLFALECLAGIRGELTLTIVGPKEDAGYWSECQARIATLPANVRIRVLGSLPHADVRPIMRENDVFLFPTLGENFGHVIIEALLAALPVITSDTTPWRNLADARAGVDLPVNSLSQFRQAIQDFVNMDEGEFDQWRVGARRLGNQRLNDDAVVEANRALFRAVLGMRQ